MKKYFSIFISILALILLIACTFIPQDAAAATVPEGHVGIVISFGKAQDEVLSPGFHGIFPPWKHLVKMDTRWQKYHVETSAFSKDIQQVDVKVSMNFALQRQGALKMYKDVGIDYADKIMQPLTLEAIKSIFAKYSAEELVAKRDLISEEVFSELAQELEFYALNIKEVAIEDIDFSDAFTNAIEAKQVATQTLLQAETEQRQQTLIAQAEAERARIKAEAEAEQKLIRAKADADAVKVSADAEAYRLQQENAHITDATIRKAMVERWDGKLSIISGDGAASFIDVSDLMDGE